MRQLRRFTGLALASVVLVVTGASSSGASSNRTQTSIEPSFGAPLTAMLRHLYLAISTDSPRSAYSLFFPRAAYVSMKVGLIPNPALDYQDRLIAFFNLDVGAYHQRLAGHPAPTFVRVNANPTLATWIAPGVCENRIGYWHVPGVRIVVRRAGRTMSVAVDSLISWRGVWYVVHLGPNPRPRNVGTVDGFAFGPGVAGPGGGC